MIGTLLNTAAILTGGAIGLTVARNISPLNQSRLKIALGVLTVYAGLSLTWISISGSFFSVIKQMIIVILAMMLGNFTGKLLRLQKGINQLGHYAKSRFASAASRKDQPGFSEGFVTCSLLFCVGPMAILGAIEDGLTGRFKTLAIKSLMDGLATMAFVKTFGWGVLLSAIPVLAYQGTITLGASFLQPLLEHKDLVDSINATGGLLIFSISLVILELKKVELADYLPSLIYAPLLTWFWR
jgi:uncharacterized protein